MEKATYSGFLPDRQADSICRLLDFPQKVFSYWLFDSIYEKVKKVQIN